MKAILHPVPLIIENMFLDKSDITFHPCPEGIKPEDARGNMFPKHICVSQRMVINEEPDDESVEVSIAVSTLGDSDALVNFNVSCVCIYKWDDKSIPVSGRQKEILSWAVAVQLGAIRQHLISETAKGPFKIPYYLPVCLVGIDEKDDNDPYSDR
jgi:hypothetical protein